ncbi:MAG: hypothetical protein HY062_08250 [Bacteroidetes bacterium]|nr:hypothetical protein [Bacteroidota bacterium]
MKIAGYILLLIVVTLTSCKTNLVYINVINPAPVTISNATKNVGIVSRTTPSPDNKTLNTIHQNVNGESLKLIQDATAEAIRGLNDALTQNKRFDIIKPITDVQLTTPVTGTFPSPLSWTEVEKICKDHGVDVLFVMEVFDTELKVVPINAPNKIDNITDVINTVANAQVNITTTVKTGWRIYDPQKKYIIDEHPLADNLTIVANASTVINTTEALLGRKEAIKQDANKLGHVYADRIIPYWIKVTRDYYVKGNYDFKVATRKARTGNWSGAGELWLKQTESRKRKIAGRACYNMAILGEINGDLDTAISWAQKAYENYNNKLALQYVNILKNRRKINQRVDYQLGN